jgi:hypothetical protein
MMEDINSAVEEQLRVEHPYVFRCKGEGCGKKLDPQTPEGIPQLFDCPLCGQAYETRFRSDGVAFEPIEAEKGGRHDPPVPLPDAPD